MNPISTMISSPHAGSLPRRSRANSSRSLMKRRSDCSPLPLALAVSGLFLLSSAAERITSPAMGFVRQQSVGASDTRFGLPMHRTPIWAGQIDSVTGNEISIGQTLSDGALVSGPDTYYVLVSSGVLVGYSFTVTGNAGAIITVDPNADDDVATQGLEAEDTIKVIPFWTLGTLFPGGEGIQGSSNLIDPESTVQTFEATKTGTNHSPSKVYFYYTGSVLPVGWYDNDDLGGGLQDDVALSPEIFFLVRNVTGETEDLFLTGYVPESEVGTAVGRFAPDTKQDNLLVNPYPIALTLGSSGLVASGAVTRTTANLIDPVDTLHLFAYPDGYNSAPVKTYFYYDGGLISEGWYDNDDLGGGVQDDVEIPGGAAFIVRKESGNAGTIMWIPDLPYTR